MNKIRVAKATVNGNESLIFVGYEDHEEEYKEMFDKQELGETYTISPTSHSCLATNKQILLKDEIKQIKLRIEHNVY